MAAYNMTRDHVYNRLLSVVSISLNGLSDNSKRTPHLLPAQQAPVQTGLQAKLAVLQVNDYTVPFKMQHHDHERADDAPVVGLRTPAGLIHPARMHLFDACSDLVST